MATGVEGLLDMLSAMIEDAKAVPLSNDKCVLERERALSLLDELKAQFPMELSEAQKLIAARADYIASAKREVELMKKQAEAEAEKLLDEDAVMTKARQRANELVRETEERCRELRRSANEYCEGVLRRAEETVAPACDGLRSVSEELRTARSKFHAAAVGASGGAAQGQRASFDVEMTEK